MRRKTQLSSRSCVCEREPLISGVLASSILSRFRAERLHFPGSSAYLAEGVGTGYSLEVSSVISCGEKIEGSRGSVVSNLEQDHSKACHSPNIDAVLENCGCSISRIDMELILLRGP